MTLSKVTIVIVPITRHSIQFLIVSIRNRNSSLSPKRRMLRINKWTLTKQLLFNQGILFKEFIMLEFEFLKLISLLNLLLVEFRY